MAKRIIYNYINNCLENYFGCQLQLQLHDLFPCELFRSENSAQRGKFSAGHPCGHPAKNFGQGLQILEKNKHFGTDIPRGRPWKNFGLKNFGLIFRSLIIYVVISWTILFMCFLVYWFFPDPSIVDNTWPAPRNNSHRLLFSLLAAWVPRGPRRPDAERCQGQDSHLSFASTQGVDPFWFKKCMRPLGYQKNPPAHKNKIGTSPPSPPQNPKYPPPP